MDRAERSFKRATQLGANVPQILRELADFYVKAGRYGESLPYFGRILTLLSEYDSIVFDYFDEMKLSAQDLREGGALPTPRAANAYLRHLLSAGNTSAAKDLWNWIAVRAYADDSVAASYVDFLLQRGLKDDALNAWAAYTGKRNQGYSKSTFIYNGGFELKPSGSRLDWRIDSLEHVSVARDSTIAHSGTASLRMQFDGKENIDFHHITQELVLPPGAYELAAYIRTRDLSTDEGISLWLASSEPGFALDVNTEALSGTADWKRVAKSFSIHSHSHLLTLQIRRRPSLRFDNQISGTAWIDSIVIKRDLQ